ncbi:MAG TPA: YfiR family protein [Vicinamibacteria bacterium]|nr:YfiR family protein [Vicinamibacteria bacterium]
MAALLLGAAMARAQPEPPSPPSPTEYAVEEARDAQIVFVQLRALEHRRDPERARPPGDPHRRRHGRVRDAGGAINFTMQARNVWFEINPAVTEQAGLEVSSQLLKLATLVAGPRP